MKVLKLDGYKYSKGAFEGHRFRAMFRFTVSEDWREDSNMSIYTDNPDKQNVEDVINSRKSEKVLSCKMVHWTTKEQDDLTSKFIDETLKGI